MLFFLFVVCFCFEYWNNWRCYWFWIGVWFCNIIVGFFGEEFWDNFWFLVVIGIDCLGWIKLVFVDIVRCLWCSWFLICRVLFRCVGREGVWIGGIFVLGWDFVLLGVFGLGLDGLCLRVVVILFGVLGWNWKVFVDDFFGCVVFYI